MFRRTSCHHPPILPTAVSLTTEHHHRCTHPPISPLLPTIFTTTHIVFIVWLAYLCVIE
ncbi:hypothetical protein Hanom_Chr10g00931201 [Helianthus anomalus]